MKEQTDKKQVSMCEEDFSPICLETVSDELVLMELICYLLARSKSMRLLAGRLLWMLGLKTC